MFYQSTNESTDFGNENNSVHSNHVNRYDHLRSRLFRSYYQHYPNHHLNQHLLQSQHHHHQIPINNENQTTYATNAVTAVATSNYNLLPLKPLTTLFNNQISYMLNYESSGDEQQQQQQQQRFYSNSNENGEQVSAKFNEMLNYLSDEDFEPSKSSKASTPSPSASSLSLSASNSSLSSIKQTVDHEIVPQLSSSSSSSFSSSFLSNDLSQTKHADDSLSLADLLTQSTTSSSSSSAVDDSRSPSIDESVENLIDSPHHLFLDNNNNNNNEIPDTNDQDMCYSLNSSIASIDDKFLLYQQQQQIYPRNNNDPIWPNTLLYTPNLHPWLFEFNSDKDQSPSTRSLPLTESNENFMTFDYNENNGESLLNNQEEQSQFRRNMSLINKIFLNDQLRNSSASSVEPVTRIASASTPFAYNSYATNEPVQSANDDHLNRFKRRNRLSYPPQFVQSQQQQQQQKQQQQQQQFSGSYQNLYQQQNYRQMADESSSSSSLSSSSNQLNHASFDSDLYRSEQHLNKMNQDQHHYMASNNYYDLEVDLSVRRSSTSINSGKKWYQNDSFESTEGNKSLFRQQQQTFSKNTNNNTRYNNSIIKSTSSSSSSRGFYFNNSSSNMNNNSNQYNLSKFNQQQRKPNLNFNRPSNNTNQAKYQQNSSSSFQASGNRCFKCTNGSTCSLNQHPNDQNSVYQSQFNNSNGNNQFNSNNSNNNNNNNFNQFNNRYRSTTNTINGKMRV